MIKFAVLEKPGHISIVEKTLPPPQNGQLRVKVELAGVCSATELHYYSESDGSFPLDSFNSYFGHEGCGTVLEAGANASGFSEGDRITYLGPCFSEEANVASARAVKIPDSLTFEEAIGEPLAVAANALEHCGELLGRDVLVTGAGPVGLLLIQGIKSSGAKATVVELKRERARLAKKIGAAEVVTNPDAVGETLADRFPIAVEASGSSAGLALCGEALATNGTLIINSFFPEPINVNMVPWHCKQITVVNSHIPTDADLTRLMAKGLRLAERGVLDLPELITHRWRLAELDEAFKLMERGEFSAKMTVRP